MLCYTQPLTLTCYTHSLCHNIVWHMLTRLKTWTLSEYRGAQDVNTNTTAAHHKMWPQAKQGHRNIGANQVYFNLWMNNSIWRREYLGCGVITSETLTLRLKRYYDFACIISCLMESSGLAMLTSPCVGKGTGQISTKFGVKFAQLWVTDPGEAHSQNWLVFTCSELF